MVMIDLGFDRGRLQFDSSMPNLGLEKQTLPETRLRGVDQLLELVVAMVLDSKEDTVTDVAAGAEVLLTSTGTEPLFVPRTAFSPYGTGMRREYLTAIWRRDLP